MQDIVKIQEGKPLSDSTLEVTTLKGDHDRSAQLEKIVQEKENEIEKLRAYYTQVVEKIEEEHRNQQGGEDS
jgi:hypothetical protein